MPICSARQWVRMHFKISKLKNIGVSILLVTLCGAAYAETSKQKESLAIDRRLTLGVNDSEISTVLHIGLAGKSYGYDWSLSGEHLGYSNTPHNRVTLDGSLNLSVFNGAAGQGALSLLLEHQSYYGIGEHQKSVSLAYSHQYRLGESSVFGGKIVYGLVKGSGLDQDYNSLSVIGSLATRVGELSLSAEADIRNVLYDGGDSEIHHQLKFLIAYPLSEQAMISLNAVGSDTIDIVKFRGSYVRARTQSSEIRLTLHTNVSKTTTVSGDLAYNDHTVGSTDVLRRVARLELGHLFDEGLSASAFAEYTEDSYSNFSYSDHTFGLNLTFHF